MQLSVLINEHGYFWHLLNEQQTPGEIYDFMSKHGDDVVGEMVEEVGNIEHGTYIFDIADAQIEDCWIDADLDGRPVYGRWLEWGEIVVKRSDG